MQDISYVDHYAGLGLAVCAVYRYANGSCNCEKGSDCTSPGKHPRGGAINYAFGPDAVDLIESYGEENCNIGFNTQASNLFVFDIDPAKGGSNSAGLLAKEHGRFPETWVAKTHSGGFHYYFNAVGNMKNLVGVMPGIDGRGTPNGFIVAPPSVSSQGVYTWLRGPWDCELADPPQWMVEMFHKEDKNPLPTAPRRTTQMNLPYGNAVVLNLLAEVASADVGRRNDTLFHAAARMGELCAGGVIIDDGCERLREAAFQVFDVQRDAAEVERCINNGWARGMGDPRGVPTGGAIKFKKAEA